MTRRRWIADEYDLASNRAAITGVHAAHLARVLRARVGQQFDIAVQESGKAVVRTGTVASVSDGRVEFELGPALSTETGQVNVTLLLAIFKFDRMEWAIEKAIELGVREIVPVIARRSEKHLIAAAEKRAERWRRIAHKAAEQSRQARIAEIPVPAKLKEVVAQRDGLCIVLSEQGGTPLSRLVARHSGLNEIVLAIGPEGGWTADEFALFASAGFQPASLSHGILRAETAAIAALAIVTAHCQGS